MNNKRFRAIVAYVLDIITTHLQAVKNLHNENPPKPKSYEEHVENVKAQVQYEKDVSDAEIVIGKVAQAEEIEVIKFVLKLYGFNTKVLDNAIKACDHI